MRLIALTLSLALSTSAFASTTLGNKPRKPASSSRPEPASICVSLLNMSSHSREVVLPNGNVRLPAGVRVDVLTHNGATLTITSDTESRYSTKIHVTAADAAGLIPVL